MRQRFRRNLFRRSSHRSTPAGRSGHPSAPGIRTAGAGTGRDALLEHLTIRVAGAGAATAAILAGCVAPAAAAPTEAVADPAVHYVALGDSYAAGAGVLPLEDVTTCARSRVNYPTLVARRLRAAAFADATCGGATLDDLTGSQPALLGNGHSAPQFDVLGPEATLVTITMGGNDIGLASTALHCFTPIPALGRSCTDAFTASGHDEFATRLTALRPAWDRALDEIRSRAPHATVVVVGYPTVARPGGCASQPVLARDSDYLSTVLLGLNAVLRDAAAAHGVRYLDTATPSVGHDMCAAPDQQWVSGFYPTASGPALAPLHPNAIGEQRFADEIVAALG